MGTLVVSLDAELAWGFHHVDPPADRLAEARRAWKRLVGMFDRHEVPATWAVVGHLFLDECAGDHRGHPGGEDLCERNVGSLPARRAWYADGLVETVRDAQVPHEVAGHGFTHVHFDHDAFGRADARAELEWTRQAARRRGFDPTSFVFPVNEMGYRRLLAEAGFGAYRGWGPSDRPGRSRRRVQKAGRAVLDHGSPPLVQPHVDAYGLVNVPASMYLFDELGPLQPFADTVHGDPVTARAIRGVEAAADGDGVLHLWFHPHNLSDARSYERVRAVLERAATLRDHGDLRIRTMADVAATVGEGPSDAGREDATA